MRHLLTSCLFVAVSSLVVAAQLQQAQITEFPEPAKRWALIIGVDDYIDTQINPNVGAVNDARAIADALVRYAGFPKEQVVLLTTDQPVELQPRRERILRQLATFRASSVDAGLLLFAFAGHGMQVKDQAYLLPSDAGFIEGDFHFLQDTAISMSTLREYLQETNLPQIIAVFDACRDTPVERGARGQEGMGAPYQLSFDLQNKGVVAFATLYASQPGSKSFEDSNRKQGYFSEAFVEALEGKEGAINDNGFVTLSTLVDYLQKNVPVRVSRERQGAVQLPYALIEGFKAQQLVLARKGPPPAQDPRIRENPKDGLTYVIVPAGKFEVGCIGASDTNCYRNEKPQRQVSLPEFEIGQTEVTVAAYRRFVEKNPWTSLPKPPHFNPEWRDQTQPVTKVTLEEAKQYCQWAGGRLPTEAEWEYAARGGLTGELFPWGSVASHDYANYGAEKCCEGLASPNTRDRWKYAAPVGSFPPNRFGLYDTAGNVAEWVEDSYEFTAPSDTTTQRVVKGGSWLSTPFDLRVSSRLPMEPTTVADDVGFRCMRPIPKQ